MDLSGTTNIIGIFGYPIDHTLSPLMHNAAFRALNMNNCYVAFKVLPEDLPDAVRAVKSLNLLGVNITVPHKEQVIPLLDEVNEEARFIGAVNTVVNNEGRLTGYNTDGRGFMSSLSEAGISVEDKEVVIIGTGGAARAISYYLSKKASHLSLFDIDTEKSEKLVSDLRNIRSNVDLLESAAHLGNADIVINATPLGLHADDPLPVQRELISSSMTVCDLVYKTTGLLRAAQAKGAATIDGSGMLLWQGVLAFELWTGMKPPVNVMKDILLSNIK
jgi:shikimate dehydrogenase